VHARIRGLLCLIALVALWSPSATAAEAPARLFDNYAGNYRVSSDRIIGINPFIMDDRTSVMLIADYSSGVVRRLFPVEGTEFVMGPGFNTAAPAELTVRFTLDKHGSAKTMSLRHPDGTQSVVARVALKREEVTFQGVEAQLAGTLIVPPTKGPHPAIVLLHGSGPLTRYSFGPYPNFFSSLGLAVLIYDKRGTGNSTGLRLDASTGIAMRNSRYPDELAGDALAAMRFLQQRADIDPKRIGFWGSSEGGMLTSQVACGRRWSIRSERSGARSVPRQRSSRRNRHSSACGCESHAPAKVGKNFARPRTISRSPAIRGCSRVAGRSHPSNSCAGIGTTSFRSIQR
jgi:hypothetical protein